MSDALSGFFVLFAMVGGLFLMMWLRSRGDHNSWAEVVVAILLNHHNV